MTVAAITATLASRYGARLVLRPGALGTERLTVTPRRRLDPMLRAAIRRSRTDLVRALRAEAIAMQGRVCGCFVMALATTMPENTASTRNP